MTKLSTKIARYLTLSNIKTTATIALAAASIFGVIAPDTATRLRNEVLLPLSVVSTMQAGDL